MVDKGRKTDLFKMMKEHGRTRLTSGVWADALRARGQARAALIDRAVNALGGGIASAVNLLDVELVIIGGGLGVRFGQRYSSESSPRCSRICFSTTAPRGSRSPSWAISAARSARRCFARTAAPLASSSVSRTIRSVA